MTLVCPYLVDTGMFKGCRIRLASTRTCRCNCLFCVVFFFFFLKRSCTWLEFVICNFHHIKLPRKHLLKFKAAADGLLCQRYYEVACTPLVSAVLRQRGRLSQGKTSAAGAPGLSPPSCCNSLRFVSWLQSAGGMFFSFTVVRYCTTNLPL